MGDINLRTKINNLDERVSKVEESGGGDATALSTADLSNSATGNIRSLHLYGKSEKTDDSLIISAGVVKSANADNTQTSTINASEILNSIFTGVNNIKDELIVNADGSGKFIKRVSKVEYTKDSSWVMGNATATYRRIAIAKPSDMNAVETSGYYNTICNLFTNEYDKLGGLSIGGAINFCVDLSIDTLDKFKTWLGDNTIELYYCLITPIETDLTPSQLSDLLSLKTFIDNTIITSDCDYEIGYFLKNWQSVSDVNTKADKNAKSIATLTNDLSMLIETLKTKGVID